MRPSWIEFRIPFMVIDYGVKWHVYEPEVFVSSQPWADGPYCPKCNRELEEKTKDIFSKGIYGIVQHVKKPMINQKVN